LTALLRHRSIYVCVCTLVLAPTLAAAQKLVTGTGAGMSPAVRVIDASGTDTTFLPYDAAFLGGVRVALGDVTGDGVLDIITAAGPGGGPHVRVWNGTDLTEVGGFFAYDPAFTGGVFVAAGDVTGDGKADIITGAGVGGGPHVRVFDGATFAEVGGFFAYDPAFPGGVFVAAGDVTGDGVADIVTGAGPGGGPHVRIWNGTTLTEVGGFFAYDPAFSGGVHVAVGDITGDGKAEIVTGAGPSGGPHVRVWNGADLTEVGGFFAYDPAFGGGVVVGLSDLDRDGKNEILTAPGPGAPAQVRIWSGTGFSLWGEYLAAPPAFSGGVFIGSVAENPSTDHAPSVTTTTPADGATAIPVDANLVVTFSEPVHVAAGAFVLECPTGTPIALTTVTASPATQFTLDPTVDLPTSTTCTLRVVASQVTDDDGDDPPDTMAAEATVSFTTAACAAITVSPTSVPGGNASLPYGPVTFSQVGGTPPITWNVSSGTLPAGLMLAPTTGILSGTPTQSGAFPITITATAANTCSGSVPVTLNIAGPNQAPSFVVGPNQTVAEDAGPQTVTPWATAISPGPPDESAQTVTFNITGNTNAALFSAAPAVSPTGVLTYTSAPNASGTATITVVLQDNGGTALGGVDTSAPQSFTITVTGINDAPSFTPGANPSGPEDAGPQTIANWATAISTGPADEAGQSLTFVVTNNTNAALFSAAPAVAPTGTLTYTSAPNAFGTAVITLVIQDNGGTAGGGVDTSAPVTFTITVTPINDPPTLTTPVIAYSTVGNTQLHVAGATLAGLASIADTGSILSKSAPVDADGPAVPTVVAFSGATPNGTVTMNANGSFTYVPNAGFTGVDSFTFQVTDSLIPVTGTINITVSNMVWYVNNQTGANNQPGGDGRSTDAFETLAEAEATSAANDIIFVFNGLTGTTPLTGGIALKNGQKLHGEGIGLTVGSFVSIVPAGSQPRIQSAGNTVAVLANTANGDRTGVEIRGLDLRSTAGNAIDVTSANTQNLGIRISENTISGSGAAFEGIDVNQGSTGTATLAVNDNIITASGTGLDITRTAGTMTITAFDDNTISGDTIGNGIFIIGPVTFDATPGGTFNPVNGGTTRVGVSGNGVSAAGMVMTTVTGALDFVDLDIFADTNAALSVTGTGVFTGAAGTRITVTAGASILAASAGPAVSLTNLTADLQLGGLTSANSVGDGVLLSGVVGTFTAPSTAAITNASGVDFNILGGTANVTFNGTITDDLGVLVSVTSAVAGTKSFTGAITDGNDGDGSGITLTNNTGATITFSGGLTLSTGGNPAFTATGGGTINVCDENPCNPAATGALINTIATTTATALNVANTSIGTNHLEFRSISSGTAASGPANGIILNNTGTTAGFGGLKIKGTAGTGTGGTIQRSSDAGVMMTSTRDVSFASLLILNGGDDGIRGLNVTNFTMTNSTVSTNGNAVTERGLEFTNLLGTASITGSTITGSAEDNLYVKNGTGTLTFATSSTNFTNTSAAVGNDGILFLGADVSGSNNANMSISVTNCTFTSNRGDHFQAATDAASSATMSVTFQNNDLNNVVGTNLGAGLTLNIGGTATMTFNVSNNGTVADPFTGAFSSAITVNTVGSAQMSGHILNNVIGNPAVIDSGSFSGDGINIAANGASQITVAVANNKIHGYSNLSGINIHQRDGNGSIHATVTGNTVSNPGTFASNGLVAQAGAIGTDAGFLCVDVGGAGAAANSLAGSGANGGTDFRVRQRFGTTVRLPGFAGGSTDTAAVVTFIQGRNTGSETGSATVQPPAGFLGGAPCNIP
jgi:Bacterial Ig-like domain/Bacterial Ig domain/FG-GAP-like repeat